VGDAEGASRSDRPAEGGDGERVRGDAVAPGSILFNSAHVSSDGEVLIIGDSHILLCGAHRAFPGCDVHARHGRRSTGGLEVLERAMRRRHRVIVFDLATNEIGDPQAFAANLELLWERTGDRELVLVNTWRADGGNTHRDVNAIQRRFVEAHSERAALVDWAAYIDAHPGPLGPDPDYVHFTADAYRDRIELLSEAIAAALARAA